MGLSEQEISRVPLGCWDEKIYLLCFFQACKSGIGTLENLLTLKDGMKHMEKELGGEFVVFPLEPCPGRCSREVRSGQGRTPRLSGRFLPRAPSCSQALFLGSFNHSPPRSISSLLSLERSRERRRLQRWVPNRARNLLGRLEMKAPAPATKPGAAANL